MLPRGILLRVRLYLFDGSQVNHYWQRLILIGSHGRCLRYLAHRTKVSFEVPSLDILIVLSADDFRPHTNNHILQNTLEQG